MTISLTPDSSSLNVMSYKINLKITKLYKENRFFGAFSFSFNVGLWCKCDIKTDCALSRSIINFAHHYI